MLRNRARSRDAVLSGLWPMVKTYRPPLNFITLHYAYFVGVCLISSVIFWGASTPARHVSYTDSLFLVISAMTLAGLNTVNLSVLNTFQQIILFVLTLLGSAILVSIMVVHTRKIIFERRFKSIVKEHKERRRTRARRSQSNLSPSAEPEVDGIVVRGKKIQPENDDDARNLDGSAETRPGDAENTMLDDAAPSGEDNTRAPTAQDEPSRQSREGNVIQRIAFAEPASPTRRRTHMSILSMHGVGATSSHMNHPIYAKSPISSSDLPRIDENDGHHLHSFASRGYISKNSHFVNLSFEERQSLGGVEYRALQILAALVPLYFVLWQLLGCLGLGAYVAHNRAEAALKNGLNPWWVGIFNGVSAFNNNGMSLLDANMTAFSTSIYMLITMGLLILAGNTCYPIFLRLIIWTIAKLLPAVGPYKDYKTAFEFLLDHPRRCYTNLFPKRHTWWLFAAVIVLNGIDWIAFEVLNIGNLTVTSLPHGARALDGLFQALAVRSGGFYVVSIPGLRMGLLVLYVIMMYISVYPVVITMRHSNVYEERSLGIYADDGSAQIPESEESEKQGFPQQMRRAFTNSQSSETRGYFIRQQLRSQLSHDLWWISLAVFFITIAETSNIERDPVSYSIFNILFEVVSTYGCVGISVGLPNEAYSFCGGFHTISKLILCLVMLRGRHRGLPVAIDRAILLPSEHLAAAEDEDAKIRSSRSVRTFEKERIGS